MFNEIKFYSKFLNNKIKILNLQNRNFSTSSKFSNNNIEPDLDNLDYMSDQSLWDKKNIRDFKKAYGGGYLGYSYSYNFGNITEFTSYTNNLEFDICKSNLESKLKDYIYVIPATETWSILPVLRWELSGGQYRALTLSESIKINKNISTSLLAETIIHDISNMFSKYNLLDGDIELYMMGRPWLDVDEFDLDRFLDRNSLSDLFNKVLEKKLLT